MKTEYKMTKTALVGLFASITVWKEKVGLAKHRRYGSITIGQYGCPLCAIYNNSFIRSRNCEGCPIKETTGKPGCNGTPYVKVRLFYKRYHHSLETETFLNEKEKKKHIRPSMKGYTAACRAEVKFLESLLPTKEEIKRILLED